MPGSIYQTGRRTLKISTRNHLPVGYKKESIVDIHTGAIVGWEILRRPAPFSEGKKDWRLWYSRLARDIGGILDSEIAHSGFVTINLDDWQFFDHEIIEAVSSISASFRRAGRQMAIEWTERGNNSISDTKKVSRILDMFREKMGVLVFLDDMGSGMDFHEKISLIYPDYGKISGTIFHESRKSERAIKMVRSMHELLESMNSKTIVEWIETDRDREIALSLGIRYGQGYLYGKQ